MSDATDSLIDRPADVADAHTAMPSLKGRRVAITGGTTGIGRAIAVLLASEGAKVFICGRDDAYLKDALDRITISQDVLNRIAPTALPRSSIIVSDEPLSSETNYRTEFVAVLKNQPQGGFVTRQPSGNVWGDDGVGSFFQRNWDSQSGNTRRRGGPGWW